MTSITPLTMPISVAATHLRAPAATIRFGNGAEDLSVSAVPLDALLEAELRPPFPTVRPVVGGVSVSYPIGHRRQPRAGPSIVRVDAGVTWSLVFSGGASLVDLHLAAARVSGVSFAAGATSCRIVLPRPNGTCRISMHTAVDVVIERPSDVAVRVEVRRRRSGLVIDGVRLADATGWSSHSTDGYGSAPDRYLVVVDAAADGLHVEPSRSSAPADIDPLLLSFGMPAAG